MLVFSDQGAERTELGNLCYDLLCKAAGAGVRKPTVVPSPGTPGVPGAASSGVTAAPHITPPIRTTQTATTGGVHVTAPAISEQEKSDVNQGNPSMTRGGVGPGAGLPKANAGQPSGPQSKPAPRLVPKPPPQEKQWSRRTEVTPGKFKVERAPSAIGKAPRAGEEINLHALRPVIPGQKPSEHVWKVHSVDEHGLNIIKPEHAGVKTADGNPLTTRMSHPEYHAHMASNAAHGDAYAAAVDSRVRAHARAFYQHVHPDALKDPNIAGLASEHVPAALQNHVNAAYKAGGAALEKAFKRAGVGDDKTAKNMVGFLLTRRGWHQDARGALMGAAVNGHETSRIAKNYKGIALAAEKRAGKGMVTSAIIADVLGHAKFKTLPQWSEDKKAREDSKFAREFNEQNALRGKDDQLTPEEFVAAQKAEKEGKAQEAGGETKRKKILEEQRVAALTPEQRAAEDAAKANKSIEALRKQGASHVQNFENAAGKGEMGSAVGPDGRPLSAEQVVAQEAAAKLQRAAQPAAAPGAAPVAGQAPVVQPPQQTPGGQPPVQAAPPEEAPALALSPQQQQAVQARIEQVKRAGAQRKAAGDTGGELGVSTMLSVLSDVQKTGDLERALQTALPGQSEATVAGWRQAVGKELQAAGVPFTPVNEAKPIGEGHYFSPEVRAQIAAAAGRPREENRTDLSNPWEAHDPTSTDIQADKQEAEKTQVVAPPVQAAAASEPPVSPPAAPEQRPEETAVPPPVEQSAPPSEPEEQEVIPPAQTEKIQQVNNEQRVAEAGEAIKQEIKPEVQTSSLAPGEPVQREHPGGPTDEEIEALRQRHEGLYGAHDEARKKQLSEQMRNPYNYAAHVKHIGAEEETRKKAAEAKAAKDSAKAVAEDIRATKVAAAEKAKPQPKTPEEVEALRQRMEKTFGMHSEERKRELAEILSNPAHYATWEVHTAKGEKALKAAAEKAEAAAKAAKVKEEAKAAAEKAKEAARSGKPPVEGKKGEAGEPKKEEPKKEEPKKEEPKKEEPKKRGVAKGRKGENTEEAEDDSEREAVRQEILRRVAQQEDLGIPAGQFGKLPRDLFDILEGEDKQRAEKAGLAPMPVDVSKPPTEPAPAKAAELISGDIRAAISVATKLLVGSHAEEKEGERRLAEIAKEHGLTLEERAKWARRGHTAKDLAAFVAGKQSAPGDATPTSGIKLDEGPESRDLNAQPSGSTAAVPTTGSAFLAESEAAAEQYRREINELREKREQRKNRVTPENERTYGVLTSGHIRALASLVLPKPVDGQVSPELHESREQLADALEYMKTHPYAYYDSHSAAKGYLELGGNQGRTDPAEVRRLRGQLESVRERMKDGERLKVASPEKGEIEEDRPVKYGDEDDDNAETPWESGEPETYFEHEPKPPTEHHEHASDVELVDRASSIENAGRKEWGPKNNWEPNQKKALKYIVSRALEAASSREDRRESHLSPGRQRSTEALVAEALNNPPEYDGDSEKGEERHNEYVEDVWEGDDDNKKRIWDEAVKAVNELRWNVPKEKASPPIEEKPKTGVAPPAEAPPKGEGWKRRAEAGAVALSSLVPFGVQGTALPPKLRGLRDLSQETREHLFVALSYIAPSIGEKGKSPAALAAKALEHLGRQGSESWDKQKGDMSEVPELLTKAIAAMRAAGKSAAPKTDKVLAPPVERVEAPVEAPAPARSPSVVRRPGPTRVPPTETRAEPLSEKEQAEERATIERLKGAGAQRKGDAIRALGGMVAPESDNPHVQAFANLYPTGEANPHYTEVVKTLRALGTHELDSATSNQEALQIARGLVELNRESRVLGGKTRERDAEQKALEDVAIAAGDKYGAAVRQWAGRDRNGLPPSMPKLPPELRQLWSSDNPAEKRKAALGWLVRLGAGAAKHAKKLGSSPQSLEKAVVPTWSIL